MMAARHRATALRKNPSERAVQEQLIGDGFKVYWTGWPDFIAVHPNGTVRFIEVKNGATEADPHQFVVHQILARYGITVEVVNSPHVMPPGQIRLPGQRGRQ